MEVALVWADTKTVGRGWLCGERRWAVGFSGWHLDLKCTVKPTNNRIASHLVRDWPLLESQTGRLQTGETPAAAAAAVATAARKRVAH